MIRLDYPCATRNRLMHNRGKQSTHKRREAIYATDEYQEIASKLKAEGRQKYYKSEYGSIVCKASTRRWVKAHPEIHKQYMRNYLAKKKMEKQDLAVELMKSTNDAKNTKPKGF